MLLLRQGALRTHFQRTKKSLEKDGVCEMKAWSIESLFYSFALPRKKTMECEESKAMIINGLQRDIACPFSFYREEKASIRDFVNSTLLLQSL